MSGDLDITGGGAIAVDTDTVRTAAAGFAGLAEELDEIARVADSDPLQMLFTASDEVRRVALAANDISTRAARAGAAALDLADRLRQAAAVYEIVELQAERAVAEASGDATAVARIDRRLAGLADEYPDAAVLADRDARAWSREWSRAFGDQAAWGLATIPGVGLLGGHLLATALAGDVRRLGAGTIPRDARLAGTAGSVVVRPVPAGGPSAAPSSLAGAAQRMPAGTGQIRVERYTMADGSRQFAVYVSGTRAAGGTEPFDNRSNLRLYSGQRSDSYDATVIALDMAGARPGDTVHAFGHSQGAMITAHLALEGGYETRTLVSFGSPVEADVGPGTLSVNLRHTDDPVAVLAGGGHAGSVGASGSFVAERVADPLAGPHDLRLPSHRMDAYAETAAMLDASTDSRMAAVRGVFDELGAAASVDVMEFEARRPGEPGNGGR